MRERRQQSRAEQQLQEAKTELVAALAEERAALEEIEASAVPAQLKLEKLEIPPRKSDIAVSEVLLVWLPWWINDDGAARPAY
jgi:hypothetical protein